MGRGDDYSQQTAARADGGVIERGRRHQTHNAHRVHAQPGVQRHELPGSIRVGAYHEYHHADRWTAADAPLSDDQLDWLASDEWLAYDVDIRESGPYDLSLRVAAAAGFGGGDVGIVVDDEPLRRISIGETGGWYSWEDIETQVELPRGLHTIRLVVFEGGWKLKELRFR